MHLFYYYKREKGDCSVSYLPYVQVIIGPYVTCFHCLAFISLVIAEHFYQIPYD